MSALFYRGPGIVSQTVTLGRTLELRNIPFVFPTWQTVYPGSLNDYSAVVIADLYKNMSAHWMYTATIQLSLNGSEPAWSKDGWSFVPATMDTLQNVNLPNDLDTSDLSVDGARSNVSFSTPALRGRIECSPPPTGALLNISNWLTPRDLSNLTYWNKSTIPQGLKGGYQLGKIWGTGGLPSRLFPFVPPDNVTECPGCTSIFASPSEIICCGNSSDEVWNPTVAVGHWSPNIHPDLASPRDWHLNFTTKLFYGRAVSNIRNIPRNNEGGVDDIGLLFPSPPSTSLMNCKPVIESAMADVTVNPETGEIQEFNITDTPKELLNAFEDNFLPHNKTYASRETARVDYNVTLR